MVLSATTACWALSLTIQIQSISTSDPPIGLKKREGEIFFTLSLGPLLLLLLSTLRCCGGLISLVSLPSLEEK